MAMKGISIIVPLYNKEETICNCLDKILDQTINSYEVIVVDDGSTDNSVANIQKYKDRITLLYQENQGPSVARNTGAENSTMPCLAFVDADDEISPDFVECHLSVRQAVPEVELSINSFKVYENNELKNTEYLFDRCNVKKPDENFFIPDEFNHEYVINVHSGGYCVNKDIFLKASGFDEVLKCWEITDALTRFSLLSGKIAIINDVLSVKFNTVNSQFLLEKDNLEYQQQYCDNILEVIEKIPDHSKSRYFKEIRSLCYAYWKTLKFNDLVRLYKKTTAIPSARVYFTLPVKIRMAAEFLKFFYPK